MCIQWISQDKSLWLYDLQREHLAHNFNIPALWSSNIFLSLYLKSLLNLSCSFLHTKLLLPTCHSFQEPSYLYAVLAFVPFPYRNTFKQFSQQTDFYFSLKSETGILYSKKSLMTSVGEIISSLVLPQLNVNLYWYIYCSRLIFSPDAFLFHLLHT